MAHNVRFINPTTISKPPGYTHVVEITGPGRIAHIAGQLGLDTSGKLAGAPGDFSAQAAQAFENLKAALGAVGAGAENIVKINSYIVDIGKNIVRFANCAIAISIWQRRRPAPRLACRHWRYRARCSRSKLLWRCRPDRSNPRSVKSSLREPPW